MPENTLQLVGFHTCPFAQRSVVAMLYKRVSFELTYIDPDDKPDWFMALSPLGKVPILRVGDVVLFESAVITEYIDETNPPSLHPSDPLTRAQNRAWIEFGSQLLGKQHALLMSQLEQEYLRRSAELIGQLRRLEHEVRLPYFNGDDFSLVDAAFAPFFMRLAFISARRLLPGWSKLDALVKWSDNLAQLQAVRQSVPVDFERRLEQRLLEHNSILTSETGLA